MSTITYDRVTGKRATIYTPPGDVVIAMCQREGCGHVAVAVIDGGTPVCGTHKHDARATEHRPFRTSMGGR